MKKLLVLIVAVLVLGLTGGLMAESGGATATGEAIGGAIPFNAQWTFTVADQTTELAGADETVYDADSIKIADVQVCSDLDANDSLSVAAKVSWSLPGDYPTNGQKNSPSTTSDFAILVNNTDQVAAEGTYADYTLLKDTDLTILSSSNTGAGGVGVEGASFDIDCAILLDWKTDVQGSYTATMTLTLSQEDGS